MKPTHPAHDLTPLNRLSQPLRAWKQAWQRRVQSWWERRLRPSDQITLVHNQVYILPTRSGVTMGMTLMILLLTSINYQLNLGYLLTFLLTGCVLVSVYVCHRSLLGLQAHMLPPSAHFCGDNVQLLVALHNTRKSPRYAIGLSLHQIKHWAYCDVPAQGQAELQISFEAQGRGWMSAPILTLQTHFPLGVMRAWTVWRPLSKVLVYPRPEANPPPFLTQDAPTQGQHHATPRHSTQSMEFDGVRPYRRGDTMKHIVWKKTAQNMASGSSQLISRDHAQNPQQALWLTYVAHHPLGHEGQLSRLCAWVLQAHQLDIPFGLRLPHQEIGPNSGLSHRQQCLEALALC